MGLSEYGKEIKMIGRQVIKTTKAFTLDELMEFMNANWDVGTCGGFTKGKPTPASIEEYVLLPATDNYMVILYSRKAGLFSKDPKVILAVCDTPQGAVGQLITSLPTRNAVFGVSKIAMVADREKERKGPAEETLQFYTENMKKLLGAAGYIK